MDIDRALKQGQVLLLPAALSVGLVALGCVKGTATQAGGAATAGYSSTEPRLDTHLHLDGMYWQDGPNSSVVTDFGTPAATSTELMDVLDVAAGLVMPPPFSPEFRDSPFWYDYTDLAGIAEKNPTRFGFLGGGALLNPIIHETPSGQVTDDIRARFEQTASEIAAAGASGFGEMAALHLSFFEDHPFLETQPDHELFLFLADIAASHGLPIDLHMEAVVNDLELRPVFGPPNPQPPDIVHANIEAFGRLLSHNPSARIVWVHVGWDNTGDMTVELLRDLLEQHSNLYMSIKVVADSGVQFSENSPLDESGEVRPEWLDLLLDFQNRFLVGADEFIGIPGQTPTRPPSLEATWGFIDRLPEDLGRSIAHDNVFAVYGSLPVGISAGQ